MRWRWIGLLLGIAMVIAVVAALLRPQEEINTGYGPKPTILPWFRIELEQPPNKSSEIWHILPGGRVEWLRRNAEGRITTYAEPAHFGNGIYQALAAIIDDISPQTTAPVATPGLKIQVISTEAIIGHYDVPMAVEFFTIFKDIQAVDPGIEQDASNAFLLFDYVDHGGDFADSTRAIGQAIRERQILSPLSKSDIGHWQNRAHIMFAGTEGQNVIARIVRGETPTP